MTRTATSCDHVAKILSALVNQYVCLWSPPYFPQPLHQTSFRFWGSWGAGFGFQILGMAAARGMIGRKYVEKEGLPNRSLPHCKTHVEDFSLNTGAIERNRPSFCMIRLRKKLWVHSLLCIIREGIYYRTQLPFSSQSVFFCMEYTEVRVLLKKYNTHWDYSVLLPVAI